MPDSIILLFIFFVCNSCQETPEAKFEKDGITLISPKGWKITDEENLDDQGYHLSVSVRGIDLSRFCSDV